MSSDLYGKLLALLCPLTWAFAVILYKQSGETIRPVALNFYKSAVSVVMFLPLIFIFDGTVLPADANWKDVWMLTISGFIGITIADSLFFKSLNLLGAGLSAIVDCLYSPFLIVLSCLFLGEVLTIRDLCGLILVLTAILVATLKVKHTHAPAGDIFKGIALGVTAMLALTSGVIFMKPSLDKLSLLWVTEVRMIAGTVTLAAQIWFHRDRKTLIKPLLNKSTWITAFPGTVLGNVLAMIFWVGAFKLTQMNTAAILNQTSTIFIVILATLLLKETFTFRRAFAVATAFAGALLVITG